MNCCHFISAFTQNQQDIVKVARVFSYLLSYIYITRVNSKVAAQIFYNTAPLQFVLVQNYIKGFRIVTTKSDTLSFTKVTTYIPPLSIMSTKRWIP